LHFSVESYGGKQDEQYCLGANETVKKKEVEDRRCNRLVLSPNDCYFFAYSRSGNYKAKPALTNAVE